MLSFEIVYFYTLIADGEDNNLVIGVGEYFVNFAFQIVSVYGDLVEIIKHEMSLVIEHGYFLFGERDKLDNISKFTSIDFSLSFEYFC